MCDNERLHQLVKALKDLTKERDYIPYQTDKEVSLSTYLMNTGKLYLYDHVQLSTMDRNTLMQSKVVNGMVHYKTASVAVNTIIH